MNSCGRLQLSSVCSNLFWRRFRYNPTPLVVETVRSAGFKKAEKQKKELIVNTKYDRCSDPLYQHLVYSSEIDVFLTAKRGKVWLERMYARNMAAQR